MKKVAQKLGLSKDKSNDNIAPSSNNAPTAERTVPTSETKASESKMAASEIPKTMKAAVLNGQDKPLEIKDVPLPEVQPGEILIKVHACGVCHSDHHVHHGDMGPP